MENTPSRILTHREAKWLVWPIVLLCCYLCLPLQSLTEAYMEGMMTQKAQSIPTAQWVGKLGRMYTRAYTSSNYTPLLFIKDVSTISGLERKTRSDYQQYPLLQREADTRWVQTMLYRRMREQFYARHASEADKYSRSFLLESGRPAPDGLRENFIQGKMETALEAARMKVFPVWDPAPGFFSFLKFVLWLYVCFIPWAFVLCLVRILAVAHDARHAIAIFLASSREVAVASVCSFFGPKHFDPERSLPERIAILGAYKQRRATGQDTVPWRVERQYLDEAELQLLSRADAILALWSLIWRPQGEKAGYKPLTVRWQHAVYLSLLSVVSVVTGQTAVAAETKSPIDAVNLVFVDNPRLAGGPFQSIFLFRGDTTIGIYGYNLWPHVEIEGSQYVWHTHGKTSNLVAGPYLIVANGEGVTEGGLTGILRNQIGRWQLFTLWYVGGTRDGLALYVPQFHATTPVSKTTRIGMGAAFFDYQGTKPSLLAGFVIRQKIGIAELRARLGEWLTGVQRGEPHLRFDFGFPLN